MSLQILVFFLFWAVGMVLLYLYLRNSGKVSSFNDVIITSILSGAVGFVFAYAASKANISHWLVYVAFAALGALISFKFFEKRAVK